MEKTDNKIPCKGLYKLNRANDLTTALCLALFRLIGEKGIATQEEIEEAVKKAVSELPKYRLKTMQAEDFDHNMQ